MASLGYKYKPDFSLPEFDNNLLNKIRSFKGGLRALALIEVEQFYKAAREFRKIIVKFDTKYYPQLLNFFQKIICQE